MLHNHCKQLFLKTIESHSKVDDVDPDEDLWQEVRICDLGEEIQSEIFVVVDVFLAELNHRHVIDCLNLLGEDRVQHCRQGILDIH